MEKHKVIHSVWGLARFLTLLLSSSLQAQQNLQSDLRLNGSEVLAGFDLSREVMQKSSAVIYYKNREIAYGTLISKEGYILTKASEVEKYETIDVRVDHRFYPARSLLMKDPVWDLALIKVEGESFEPAVWADVAEDQPLGSWVVVNGATSRSIRRILVGIISAKVREIVTPAGEELGLHLVNHEKGLLVNRVIKKSASDIAGIQAGDLILRFADANIRNTLELADFLRKKASGTFLSLSILRENHEIVYEVPFVIVSEEFPTKTLNDQMSGNVSVRRTGFPRVIQHDALASSQTMGGPVLNLDAHLIGLNIARSNRAETFAIPVKELKKIAEEMLLKVGKEKKE